MATSNTTNPGLKTGNKAAQQPGPITTTNAAGEQSVKPARAKRASKPRPTKEQRLATRHTYIASIATLQASRLVHIANPKAGVEPYVVAAAIVSNILVGLRNAAEKKVLDGSALQAACAAWLDASQIEEFDLPMGGTSFRRVEQPAQQPASNGADGAARDVTLANIGDTEQGKANAASWDKSNGGPVTGAAAA